MPPWAKDELSVLTQLLDRQAALQAPTNPCEVLAARKLQLHQLQVRVDDVGPDGCDTTRAQQIELRWRCCGRQAAVVERIVIQSASPWRARAWSAVPQQE